MTAYYCEPKTYPAYAATPANTTTAYDGDGLAKGIATPAVCTIDLTNYTADNPGTGDTFIVCGATLTCVTSGAGNNQFNAGSGATLASNLATAINRTTNTVTVIAPQTGWITPLLHNVIYASASGATLTIQTRAGSAKYNTAQSATWVVTSTGFTDGGSNVQINASFTGGASGAWGYLWNDVNDGTMWPLAIATGNYGVARSGTSSTNHAPMAGPAPNHDTDIIHVRCKGDTLYQTTDNLVSSLNWNFRSGFYLFDDGTEWPTNAGYLIIGVRPANSSTIGIAPETVNIRASLVNRCMDWSTGLKIVTTASRGKFNFTFQSACDILYEGILIDDNANNVTFATSTSEATNITIRRIKYTNTRDVWYARFGSFWSFSYKNSRVCIEDCLIDASSYSGADSVLVDTSNANQGNFSQLIFRNNILLAASSGHKICSAYVSSSIVVENCQGMSEATNLGILNLYAITTPAEGRFPCIIQQGLYSDEHFRHEMATHIIDWNPDGAYPTYNSYLPSGTPWSIRLQWSNSANVGRIGGTEVLKRSTYVTQSGMQTVTLEMLFDNDHSPDLSDFAIVVAYTKNSDNSVTYESTRTPTSQFDTTAIPTSAASWSGLTGAYTGWTARKLTLTLSDDIKQNTPIDVSLRMFKPNSEGGIVSVLINPEIGLSA